MATTFSFEQKIAQDILLYSVNDNFMEDVFVLRKKYNFPLENLIESESWLVSEELNLYDKDREKLREKYNIPESHSLVLDSFIAYDKICDDMGSSLWHLNPHTKTGDDDNCIILKIYPDTTLEDIQDNWPRIKNARDKILDLPVQKKNKFKNLERDIEMLKLKKQGKTSKEIIQIIKGNKKYDTKNLFSPDVPKIIKRLEERSERLMTSKQG